MSTALVDQHVLTVTLSAELYEQVLDLAASRGHATAETMVAEIVSAYMQILDNQDDDDLNDPAFAERLLALADAIERGEAPSHSHQEMTARLGLAD